MKRLLYFFAFLCIFLSGTNKGMATHIFGGDILYKHVSGNTYKVILTLYGDCGASALLFHQLDTASPVVYIFNAGAQMGSMVLRPLNHTGTEVSQVCPSEVDSTTCRFGTLPGVKQFVFFDTVILPFNSDTWRFVFKGELGPGGYLAGRSDHITNAYPGTIMQIEADLNNLTGPNNSPAYTTIPTPYYCVNVPQEYNQGADDPDGDSLSFSLVPAIDRDNSLVVYHYPFSASLPLSTSSTGFNFNPLNGQMSFNPDITQDALIVDRVYEYRGGVLIGTSEREMTFIVRDNCDGVPPSPFIHNVLGATVSNGNVINICKGNPMVNFTISLNNPDGDATTITPISVPLASSLVVLNDSTSNPSVSFSWNTDTLSPGVYTFFLKIKNNHCPIYNNQTVAYTINVAYPPIITAITRSPTQCIHNAAVEYDVSFGFKPRQINVFEGGVLVKSFMSSADTIIDSLPAGNYVVNAYSDSLCNASTSFVILDSGNLPYVIYDKSLCVGDPLVPLTLDLVAPSATVAWYALNGTQLPGPPVPATRLPAEFKYYFIENYKVCTTGPDTATVNVHSLPHGQILNIPSTVCYGDIVYLEATGGTNYTWTPDVLVKTDSIGPYVYLLEPATLEVYIKDQYNCVDTESVTYADIQPCCNFGFPNAFTPNKDGHNDGFRIVTYGNMLHFNLRIYNRWGQLVFWTGDPKKYWDGTFGGIPCDGGVYYYLLEAQCLIGRRETHKGDITLIR